MTDRPVRVLVLEDDDSLRELISDTLEDEGYEVSTAARGAEAVDCFEAAAFDLLVADVRMEGMSGLDAVAAIQQRGHRTAILVITGYAAEEDSIRAIRLGVGDYLRKPFQMQEFLVSVERLSARFREQRERDAREERLFNLGLWATQMLGLVLPNEAAERGASLAAQITGRQGSDAPDRLLGWLGTWLQMALDESRREQFLSLPAAPAELRSGSPRLESLVDLVRAAAQAPAEARSDLSRWLHDHHPGRFDPELLAALDETLLDSPSVADQRRRHARWLNLALTLADLGDRKAARRALEEAGRGPVTGPQRVETLLLASDLDPAEDQTQAGPQRVETLLLASDLDLAEDQTQAARSRLSEVEQLARNLGPVAAARAGLETGLRWLSLDSGRALSILGQAQEALTGLGDQVGLARATLASNLARGEALNAEALAVVSRPEHEQDFRKSLTWLLAALLNQEGQEPLLERVCRDHAGLVSSLLEHRRLDDTHHQALVATLERLGGGSPRLLSQLARLAHGPLARRVATLNQTSDAAPATPRLIINSFGNFRVSVGDRRVDEKAFRGSRVKHILAFLAASPRLVLEDTLIDTFWPDDFEKGKRGLYAALSVLRRALRSEESAGEPDYLVRKRDTLMLNPEHVGWHDLSEFERHERTIRESEDPAARVAAMRACVALYEGPYLDGCFMDWALNSRQKLELQLLDYLVRLAEHDHEEQRHALAVESGLRALELDGCSQPACMITMKAMAAQGKPEEATRLFQTCSRRLAGELGLEPSTELIEVHYRIRLSLP